MSQPLGGDQTSQGDGISFVTSSSSSSSSSGGSLFTGGRRPSHNRRSSRSRERQNRFGGNTSSVFGGGDRSNTGFGASFGSSSSSSSGSSSSSSSSSSSGDNGEVAEEAWVEEAKAKKEAGETEWVQHPEAHQTSFPGFTRTDIGTVLMNDSSNIMVEHTDGISDLAVQDQSNLFAFSSWDGSVSIYSPNDHKDAARVYEFPSLHSKPNPVLSLSFHNSRPVLYYGDASGQITAVDCRIGQEIQGPRASASSPISHVGAYTHESLMAYSTFSGDVCLWDVRSPEKAYTVHISDESLVSFDIRGDNIVCAGGGSSIWFLDVRNLSSGSTIPTPHTKMSTPNRVVRMMPRDSGYALGGHEGRVAIEYCTVDSAEQQANNRSSFIFKCHREGNDVYPVNDICFNSEGTFATVGANGSYCFWDKDSKQRLKNSQRYPFPIVKGKFLENQNLFLFAVSYDWSKGSQFYSKEAPNLICARLLHTNEVRARNNHRGRR